MSKSPFSNKLIVRQTEQGGMYNGILLPNKKIDSGVVLKVGSDVKDKKEGDVVFFSKFAYDEGRIIDFEGERALMLNAESVEFFLKTNK